VLKLKRTGLVTNVGTLIPPVQPAPGVPRKHALREASTEIMEAVEGHAMETGPRELRAFAQWAVDSRHTLRLQPIRRYHLAGQPEEIVEHVPDETHQW